MDYLKEKLLFLSDLTSSEKETLHLQNNPVKYLTGRSKVPYLRNSVKPPGEIYTPIYYTPDFLIKLVDKNRWGGHILTITLWDLLVVDIDDGTLDNIKDLIDQRYPDKLFYIHETNRGYHLYLLSETVRYSSVRATFYRINLGCDPAHGANSLYSGTSIRLSRKSTDRRDCPPSKFLQTYGRGKLCPEAYRIYQQVLHYLDMFQNYPPNMLECNKDEYTSNLWKLWHSIPEDMGKHQLLTVAPKLLNKDPDNGKIYTRLNHSFSNSTYSSVMMLNRFMKYRTIRPLQFPIIMREVRKTMGYNNLYRILESTSDYAIGIHLSEALHFIVYRDLFYVDYDHPSRLQIIYAYTRYHPNVVFRIVQTPKGYHVFLTSHRVNYRRSLELLTRLCSDPCQIITTYYRGYSVRINQKTPDERPYRELRKVGKGVELPELVELYKRHLELYNLNVRQKREIHNCQKKTSFVEAGKYIENVLCTL